MAVIAVYPTDCLLRQGSQIVQCDLGYAQLHFHDVLVVSYLLREEGENVHWF